MYERLLQVDNAEGDRWALALDLLREGTAVVLQSMVLEPQGDTFEVRVVSRWHQPNEHAAREQLTESQRALQRLISTDEEFASIVGNRPLHFELVDDYGMGAAPIARLDEGGEFQRA